MTLRLKIQLSPKTNLPHTIVPHEAMWSLVEYLGCRRVHVSYTYHEASFTVTFLRSDAPTAQQILDDWYAFESSAASNAPLEHSFSETAAH